MKKIIIKKLKKNRKDKYDIEQEGEVDFFVQIIR